MQNFINITVKTISDAVAFSDILKLSKKDTPHKNQSKTVGGFTNKDWENIGSDMKRGIIQFGKQ
ncbi:hypothetical protein ACVPPR_07180 [Dellaglioa sp. L3N]